MQPIQNICVTCGKPFTTSRRDSKTCSQKCRTSLFRRRKADGVPFDKITVDDTTIAMLINEHLISATSLISLSKECNPALGELARDLAEPTIAVAVKKGLING